MSGFPTGLLFAPASNVLTGLLPGLPQGLAARMAEAASVISPDGAAHAPDGAAVAALLRPLLHMLSTDAPPAPTTLWLLAACLAAVAAWFMAGMIRRRRHGAPTRDHGPPCPSCSPCPPRTGDTPPSRHPHHRSGQSQPPCTA